MVSVKRCILALVLAVSVTGVVACDSSKQATNSDAQEVVEVENKAEENEEEKPAANNKPLPFEATGVVAIVDGHEIPAEKFNAIAQRRANQMPGNIPPQMVQVYKQQTLDMVVDEYLIERKIENDKIEVSDAEVTEAFNEFKGNFPNDEVFQSFLEHNAISEDVIRTDIGKDVALRKLVSKSHDIDVDESDVKAFYEEHKQRFHQQEEVQASHILLTVEPDASEEKVEELRKRAEELAQQAKSADADFAALAREHSECPSAPNGGDLGYFSAERMVPEFSKAAFAMKPGEVSEPVKSQFGFHIIKVVDHREERELGFEEVQEQIVMQLENMALREAMTQFLSDIKEGVTIELKNDNIVDHVAAAPQPQGGGDELQQLQQQLQLQMNNPGLQD